MVKTLNGLPGMKSMENSGIGTVQRLVKSFYQIESMKQEHTILKYSMTQTQDNTLWLWGILKNSRLLI